MRKDDVVGLKTNQQFDANCNVMLEHNLPPTAEDIKTVQAAMARSCVEYGAALGFMIFQKGVFHQPRPAK